ncbi:MAG: tetratricopeptide repeat protein, partial [Deltaproteobacteria bacterium]
LYGDTHYEIAVNLNNLANVRWRRGDAAEAETLYRCTIHIKEKLLGRDHPDTALSVNNLGVESELSSEISAVSDSIPPAATAVFFPPANYDAATGRFGQGLANVLLTVKQDQLAREGKPALTPAEAEAFKRPTLEKYEREGNPYHSTARLWDDGILDPAQTRRVLGLALGVCAEAPQEKTRFGVFRM